MFFYYVCSISKWINTYGRSIKEKKQSSAFSVIKTHMLNDYKERNLNVLLLGSQLGTTQNVFTIKPTTTCRLCYLFFL